MPIAASRITKWDAGMCAEITGMTSAEGKPLNNIVGRIGGWTREGFDLIFHGPNGWDSANIPMENLRATTSL